MWKRNEIIIKQKSKKTKQNCSADKETETKTHMNAHFISISFIRIDSIVRIRRIESWFLAKDIIHFTQWLRAKYFCFTLFCWCFGCINFSTVEIFPFHNLYYIQLNFRSHKRKKKQKQKITCKMGIKNWNSFIHYTAL